LVCGDIIVVWLSLFGKHNEYVLWELRDSFSMAIDYDDLHQLIDIVDEDGDNSISYNQFIEIMSNK